MLQVFKCFRIFERGKTKTRNPNLGPYVSDCDTTLPLDTWESGFMCLVILFSVFTLEGTIASSLDVQLDTIEKAKTNTFQSQ